MTKRIFDVLLVLVTAPFWLSVFLLTALALRVFSPVPVFFTQERAGKDGKPFRLFKFRTMTDDRDENGELKDDAERMTAIGAFIRKTSLDEIPQLFNVLRAEMSIVGPRPLLMEYLPLYSNEHRRRHEVLPGITGLAQVSGRNLLSWDERFDLDVFYVDNRNLAMDIRILWATISSAARRHGIASEGSATMHRYRGPGS